jgi:hypothetical protein
MNRELRLELETQGNLLETMRAKMETFQGGGGLQLEEGGNHSRWLAFTVVFQDSTKEGRSSVSGKTYLRRRPGRKALVL